MAFKDLFIKEESVPPKQPVVAQEVAPNAELDYSGGSFIVRWIYNKFIKK